MGDAESQAVLGDLTKATIFLTVTIHEGDKHLDAVRGLFADLGGLRRSVWFKNPGEDLTCVTGIGSDLWDRMFTGPRPKGLHKFIPLNGVYPAPSTPGDLLFHIRSQSMGYCFELAKLIRERLAGHSTVEDETHGFLYFERRDLLGFVDGTENPNGKARVQAAVIGGEDPDFAGGSYVITQKYLHDLDKWQELTDERQSAIIGRHKLSDVEIPDDEKESYSHVTLNTITDADGVQLDILRANMPFGQAGNGENGTYYIAYSCEPGRTEEMLRNMFIGKPPGNYDRILDVSTAVTGCLYFVPTMDFLDDMPPENPSPSVTGADDPPAAEPEKSSGTSKGDGSLGLGSLKEGK